MGLIRACFRKTIHKFLRSLASGDSNKLKVYIGLQHAVDGKNRL